MRAKIKILTFLMTISFLADWAEGRDLLSSNQQPQNTKFELVSCGIGLFSSHQIYKASDGTVLSASFTTYKTLDSARSAMRKELKAVQRVTEKKDQVDENGKKTGEKIAELVVGESREERAIMIILESKSIYRIEAASLRHIQEFQESEH